MDKQMYIWSRNDVSRVTNITIMPCWMLHGKRRSSWAPSKGKKKSGPPSWLECRGRIFAYKKEKSLTCKKRFYKVEFFLIYHQWHYYDLFKKNIMIFNYQPDTIYQRLNEVDFISISLLIVAFWMLRLHPYISGTYFIPSAARGGRTLPRKAMHNGNTYI